jgi:hypothetical protein
MAVLKTIILMDIKAIKPITIKQLDDPKEEASWDGSSHNPSGIKSKKATLYDEPFSRFFLPYPFLLMTSSIKPIHSSQFCTFL